MVLDQPLFPRPEAAPYADVENEALIARCLAGEEAAYVSLYNLYAGMIYRLVYSMLQEREDAEEVLQDSFEYAFRKLADFDPHKSAFKTWLYRIAVSRCHNKRRRKWLPTFSLNHQDARQAADEETPTPDERVRLTETQQAVWYALQQLTPKLRETAVLRYYEGLSYQEIGDILGIPGKTAESRMRLAHQALKEMLQDRP
ncbi:MAG TPA: RNA polymerase sigma factor [Chloroflexota bacterium]|nr:RNA polymerase sigma factor [Chloroflexota bacterium]